MEYKNTQPGYFTITAFLVSILLIVILYFTLSPGNPEKPVLAALLVLFIVLMILFRSLTIKVTHNELIWYFGSGIWKYRIKLEPGYKSIFCLRHS